MSKRTGVRHLSFIRMSISCFFLSIFSPLLGFSQGQQPSVQVDFEEFSAATQPPNSRRHLVASANSDGWISYLPRRRAVAQSRNVVHR